MTFLCGQPKREIMVLFDFQNHVNLKLERKNQKETTEIVCSIQYMMIGEQRKQGTQIVFYY